MAVASFASLSPASQASVLTFIFSLSSAPRGGARQ